VIPIAAVVYMRNDMRTVEPLKTDTIQVLFESPEALQNEFAKNIANGGIFVVTEDSFAARQPVTVEIVLVYVAESSAALSLDGEIVHRIPVELASGGAVPGVAVHFEMDVAAIREAFEPLLGQEAPLADPDKDREGAKRRASKRRAVRVSVRVMPAGSAPFEAISRNLSATGILLSAKGDLLAIGGGVRICLWHPSGDPCVEIDGQVVRHVQNKHGHVVAVALAFDRSAAADSRVRVVVDGLREAGHRRRLGGISGSIANLGLANLLQMFGTSAPEGTLVVESDGEQGWIAFVGGQLLGAELGVQTGHDALVAMLLWADGRFEFEATADAKLVETAPRRPVAAALLEAVCALDELNREKADEDEPV
jgi:Tfp pilus assembly protein PilZ